MGVEVWERLVSPRQEITLTLIYWQVKINEWDTDHLYVDLAKSFERMAWRADGFIPPHLRSNSTLEVAISLALDVDVCFMCGLRLTTNSRIYSFRLCRYLHGYELLGLCLC